MRGFQEHISSGVTGGNVCFGDDERNCVILQNDIMWGTVFPYFGRDCTRLCSVERSHVVHVVYALSTAIRFRELGTNSLTRRQAEKTCQSKSGHSGGWDDGTWIRYLLYVRWVRSSRPADRTVENEWSGWLGQTLLSFRARNVHIIGSSSGLVHCSIQSVVCPMISAFREKDSPIQGIMRCSWWPHARFADYEGHVVLLPRGC